MKTQINGQTFIVGFRRTPFNHDKPKKNRRRVTEAYVKFPDGTEFSASTKCSRRDQFNRAVGREIAARRLHTRLVENGIPEDLRVQLFFALCPNRNPERQTV